MVNFVYLFEMNIRKYLKENEVVEGDLSGVGKKGLYFVPLAFVYLNLVQNPYHFEIVTSKKYSVIWATTLHE